MPGAGGFESAVGGGAGHGWGGGWRAAAIAAGLNPAPAAGGGAFISRWIVIGGGGAGCWPLKRAGLLGGGPCAGGVVVGFARPTGGAFTGSPVVPAPDFWAGEEFVAAASSRTRSRSSAFSLSVASALSAAIWRSRWISFSSRRRQRCSAPRSRGVRYLSIAISPGSMMVRCARPGGEGIDGGPAGPVAARAGPAAGSVPDALAAGAAASAGGSTSATTFGSGIAGTQKNGGSAGDSWPEGEASRGVSRCGLARSNSSSSAGGKSNAAYMSCSAWDSSGGVDVVEVMLCRSAGTRVFVAGAVGVSLSCPDISWRSISSKIRAQPDATTCVVVGGASDPSAAAPEAGQEDKTGAQGDDAVGAEAAGPALDDAGDVRVGSVGGPFG